MPYRRLRWSLDLGGGVKHFKAFTYYLIGQFVHDLMVVEAGIIITQEVISVLTQGIRTLKDFIAHEDPKRFVSSIDAAQTLINYLEDAMKVITDYLKGPTGNVPLEFTPQIAKRIKDAVRGFEAMLEKELSDLPLFCVEDKGNLALPRLILAASEGYAPQALKLLDQFMKREIDEAGRCLAFDRPTACGFHILRAVEIGIKALLHANTGTLPRMGKRNWGEYIDQLHLTKAGSTDLIDLLKILKTKRNPLMHPQDILETPDAIGIFCICQNVIETLTSEVTDKNLDGKFVASLALLPTI
jgi:hypothetical protein